jgi:hypothetical protein
MLRFALGQRLGEKRHLSLDQDSPVMANQRIARISSTSRYAVR